MTKTNETVSPAAKTPNMFQRGWTKVVKFTKNIWSEIRDWCVESHTHAAPAKDANRTEKWVGWIFYPVLMAWNLICGALGGLLMVAVFAMGIALVIPAMIVENVRNMITGGINWTTKLFSKKTVVAETVTA